MDPLTTGDTGDAGPDIGRAEGTRRGIAAGAHRFVGSVDRATVAWTAALFVAFMVVEPLTYNTSRLPIEWYESGSILISTLRSPTVVVGWIVAIVLVGMRPDLRWHRLPFAARLLQIPTVTTVVALTWHLSTLEYNFALGHGFTLDRIVLVVLAAGCVFHPGALAAFVVFAHAVTGQLNVAPMFFSWTDTMVLHQLLLVALLFIAATAVVPGIADRIGRMTTGPETFRSRLAPIDAPPPAACWALFVGVLSSWYLRSAIGKARLGWVSTNDLSNIVRAARRQHGWLGSLDAERFEQIVSFVEQWRLPIQIGALIAEFGVLAYFFSRRVSVVAAALGIALHVMVYLTTGILFWKWMAVDVSLIAVFVLVGSRGRHERPVFARNTMMVATIAVMVVHAVVSPRVTELAWYDSTFVYRFQFEAVGVSGDVYEVVPEQFAPWDSRFGQSRWFFATDTPLLVDVFGSVKSRPLLDALDRAESPDDVLDVIERFGRPVTDAQQTAAFERFLQRFMEFSGRDDAPDVMGIGLIRAPHHLWTGQPPDTPEPVYDFSEPVVRITVELTMWNLVGDDYVEVSRADVLDVAASG